MVLSWNLIRAINNKKKLEDPAGARIKGLEGWGV